MAKVPVIDIRPCDLETVREILRRHVPNHEVLAFGSRVKWTARQYSDLDLAIRSDEEIPWETISAIKNELSESRLPMMVDVLDMASVSDTFRGIIEEEYAVVQESSFVHALDECAVLVRDNIHPKNAAGMPYIGLEHIEEGTLQLKGNGLAEDVTSAKLKFKKGDILFGKLRPYFRKVIRAPFDGVCSTDIWVVRAKPGVAQDYVFYWMASDDFVNFANSGSEGTRMPRAKWQYAAQHKRAKISLEKQHKIARILGALDDKIELNRRMNRTLEAMAQAIFKSWFVDFDPVHAKSKRRPTGLPPEIAALFPAQFQDSELGKIPRGWEVATLGDVADLQADMMQPQKFPEEVLEHYSIPAYDGNRLPVIEPGANIKSGKYLVPKNAVLISKLNPQFPRVWLPDVSGAHRPVCSTEFLPFVPRHPDWRPYIYQLALSSAFQARITNLVTGTSGSHQRAKPLDILGMSFPMPSAKICAMFGIIASSLSARTQTKLFEAQVLASARDALLPGLISGGIRMETTRKQAKVTT